MQGKRKKIEVRRGKISELSKICKVSPLTVRLALRWDSDTDTQNLIRQRAKELGFIKRF